MAEIPSRGCPPKQQAPSNVQFKVFFFGRHGDGYHNDAQDYYGTPAWNVCADDKFFFMSFFLLLLLHRNAQF